MRGKNKIKALGRKQSKALEALSYTGWETPNDLSSDGAIIRNAYKFFDRDLGSFRKSIPAFHSRYDAIIRWCASGVPEKTEDKRGNGSPTNQLLKQFYQSYDWRKIRYRILRKYGRRCMCCRQTLDDGVVMHVDHIEPLRFFWDRRLDFDNLQVLCEICNHGKGNWDRTDWRPKNNG